jgi:hypothetical protein
MYEIFFWMSKPWDDSFDFSSTLRGLKGKNTTQFTSFFFFWGHMYVFFLDECTIERFPFFIHIVGLERTKSSPN